jgi:hypothetical protein
MAVLDCIPRQEHAGVGESLLGFSVRGSIGATQQERQTDKQRCDIIEAAPQHARDRISLGTCKRENAFIAYPVEYSDAAEQRW